MAITQHLRQRKTWDIHTRSLRTNCIGGKWQQKWIRRQKQHIPERSETQQHQQYIPRRIYYRQQPKKTQAYIYKVFADRQELSGANHLTNREEEK